jgi:hypothetical protein
MARRTKPELKPFYRLSELVLLTDTTRGRVLRMLRAGRVPRREMGGQKLVFVADLKAKMPILWKSIVACEQARHVSRTLDRILCNDVGP